MLKLKIANIPQKVLCIKFKQKNEYSGDHFEDEYADQVMVHPSIIQQAITSHELLCGDHSWLKASRFVCFYIFIN